MSDNFPTAIDQNPPVKVTVWVTVPDERGHNAVTGECIMHGDEKPVWKLKDAQTEAILVRALSALKGGV